MGMGMGMGSGRKGGIGREGGRRKERRTLFHGQDSSTEVGVVCVVQLKLGHHIVHVLPGNVRPIRCIVIL